MPTTIPLTATYRLQLHADFPLDRARELVPYLQRLGISHIYASPILAARPGSTHGYDVVDPGQVSPELGGDASLRALSETLAAHGLGLVLDIVPNHMGTGAENRYWDDVLTHGRASRYATWFDIDWDAPGAELRGRVHVPVLGDELEAVIGRDELRVVYEDARFRVAYYEHRLPLDPTTVHRVLAFTHHYEFPADDGERSADALRRVRSRLMPEGGAALDRETAERGVAELVSLVERSAPVRTYVDWLLTEFSAGEEGRYRMRALLDVQNYALAFWRRGAMELNYRRFFDVDELVAVRQEEPAAFDATHARVLAWIADGTLDGLRVDHVDGLSDPLGYLERLRDEVEGRRPGVAVPIFVEKILSPGERLRDEWPVDGTTGYEFLNDLEALFVRPDGSAAIERAYRRLAGAEATAGFAEAARRGKELVLRAALGADVRRLARALHRLARELGVAPPIPRAALRRALEQLIVALPVYRTYIDARASGAERGVARVVDEDLALIERARDLALERGRAPAAALRFVSDALLGAPSVPIAAVPRAALLAVIARFQQTSGPATAKGVEDTALYRYVPLASLNEVGGEPGAVDGDAAARLHAVNGERQARWPRHLLAVTTHDTKRSADVRARLDVLSEVPELWVASVDGWRRRHRALKPRVRGRAAPDASTEYLLYQTLAGVWPDPGTAGVHGDGGLADGAARAVLTERVDAYMLKAAREAKRHTSWTEPDAEFEDALSTFVRAVLEEDAGAAFRDEMDRLVARVAPAGRWNALSRILVHLTAPGTPDLYQGDELWNHALVDPDNRRPVDYTLRTRLLDELGTATRGMHDRAALMEALVASAADGRIKLYLARTTLALRRDRHALFTRGAYVPLTAVGARADHVFAFARVHDGAAALTVVPRWCAALAADGSAPVGSGTWGDTRLVLPPELAALRFHDQLTGLDRGVAPAGSGSALPVADVLAVAPVALLVGGAGTL